VRKTPARSALDPILMGNAATPGEAVETLVKASAQVHRAWRVAGRLVTFPWCTHPLAKEVTPEEVKAIGLQELCEECWPRRKPRT